jgi:hypothetical protein
VLTADEPALEQPLTFAYTVPETNRLQTTVKNASSQTLAVFDSTNDMIRTVANSSGPAAPVPGGPGVPVPFDEGTIETVSGATTLRWRTKTDPNGNVTLFEDYDAQGRAQHGRTPRFCARRRTRVPYPGPSPIPDGRSPRPQCYRIAMLLAKAKEGCDARDKSALPRNSSLDASGGWRYLTRWSASCSDSMRG